VIAVDWGTSSFRAWRLGADGVVLDRREGPFGLLAVPAAGGVAPRCSHNSSGRGSPPASATC
jgi:2-keto-3-deoxy-galactonokinase